jgi:hypothetical protein
MSIEPEQLRAFLEGSIHEDSGWTSEVVRTLTRDGRSVVDLLTGILRSESSLRQVATSSYRHLNGFDKIVLASFGRELCKLRLHVWWGDREKDTRENIHNHRWDFAAAILYGSYRFQMYEIGEGQDFYEYSYRSPEDDGYYVMNFVSRTSARCVLDAQVRAGARYHLSHISLHRVSANADQTVVTLMCQASPLSGATRVLSEKVIPNAQHVPVDRMSAVEIKTKLERVIAILDNDTEMRP